MNKQDSLDRIDRAIARHQRHELDELKSKDCDFHRQVLFERKEPRRDELPEGERVTAEILVPIVRNGIRQGEEFITDQGENHSIGSILGWLKK